MHHSPIVLDVLESHALNQVPYGYIIYNIRNKIETKAMFTDFVCNFAYLPYKILLNIEVANNAIKIQI